ncbi:MAG: DNA (cytosine-5-)-methyltransferase [Bacteroidales bacterium]|jgi:DNA (cytosine-5)-methyltransferase 1|nr:DNA (cytosine-5-)-methyltransferase [Bacteroidales bacterium]
MAHFKIIDLFAGLGGIRLGLEMALSEAGHTSECVFTSEIKSHAIKVLLQNHPLEKINGDITEISEKEIPDFDILCAGFPCQAFSAAGKRMGFADTRGTLFFHVERILKTKRPQGFILENVEGLVNHDNGRTLSVILDHLNSLDYHISYKVLNSKFFGVPQERKRIYIVGSLNKKISLDFFSTSFKKLGDILQHGQPTMKTKFINLLLSKYDLKDLYGKSIKDKRGGFNNIHSWDIGLKGDVTEDEKRLLDKILTERRKKQWASIIGIDWMDGMPLTAKQISTFYHHPNLNQMLAHLEKMGYLKLEHPKKRISITTGTGTSYARIQDESKEKGYNIVTGKLSFEINKILSPNEIAPTLVAMDMQKLYVEDNGGLRKLTLREGLRLFGYPESFKFDVTEKEGFDLLGNTVVVPVIKAVAQRLIKSLNESIVEHQMKICNG